MTVLLAIASLGVLPRLLLQGPAVRLPDGVTLESVEQGRVLFAGSGLCVACHGPFGKGLIGPDLTDSIWTTGKGSYEEIVLRITRGVPADSSGNGTAMPPRGGSPLSDEEVKMVAAYVWTLSHRGKNP
jgi:mono/diheme cytochrome c family protein